MKNPSEAIKYYDTACVILTNELKTDPDNWEIKSSLGIAYAGLGNKEKALKEGEQAYQLAWKDKMDERTMKTYLTEIYLMVGDYTNAYSNLSYLVNNESFFSGRLLEIEPEWKSLLDHPEYKTRIRKLAKI